jgi:hypothetical protein
MSTERKLAMRKNFAVIFSDIQDSVLRTLYDMPRPLLMILRLVIVIVFFENNSLCVCVNVMRRIEAFIRLYRKISSSICGNTYYAIITFSRW